MKKITAILLSAFMLTSCTVHRRANVQANEEFIVEMKHRDAASRGAVTMGLEALFLGATYLAEKTSKSLATSYKKTISINNYYNTYYGTVGKTYDEIHIKKYAKPVEQEKKEELRRTLETDAKKLPITRGNRASLTVKDVFRNEKDDLLNFHAVVGLISDPENPGVTRLSFNELRIFFSKTRVYTDENLNAKISIVIEGQWRSTDGSRQAGVLIQQDYDFKNMKYGSENQIKDPILSPWYYDIPIRSEIDNNSEFGVLKVIVQVDEYEGRKSKYVNRLPSLLKDNKKSIVQDGSSVIEKIFD